MPAAFLQQVADGHVLTCKQFLECEIFRFFISMEGWVFEMPNFA